MPKSFEQLTAEHLEWTSATFPKGTSKGALLHAKREIDEVISDIDNNAGGWAKSIEYADILGCIIDSAHREGISMLEVLNAFDYKLQINKGRNWKDNEDGSYRHIKSDEEIRQGEIQALYKQKMACMVVVTK